MEQFFGLPCACEAAEERRRAQPTREQPPGLARGWRGRRPKAAASEPNSAEVGGATEGMDVDGREDTGGGKVRMVRRRARGGTEGGPVGAGRQVAGAGHGEGWAVAAAEAGSVPACRACARSTYAPTCVH